MKAVRFTVVGIMLAGVGSAITACTAEDAIKALLVVFALSLGAGGGTTGGSGDGGAQQVFAVVLNAGSDNVTIIDLATNTTTTVAAGVNPRAVAVGAR